MANTSENGLDDSLLIISRLELKYPQLAAPLGSIRDILSGVQQLSNSNKHHFSTFAKRTVEDIPDNDPGADTKNIHALHLKINGARILLLSWLAEKDPSVHQKLKSCGRNL